ncbi:oligosaccharide flippase family protein [Haloechinothrix sp. LS1_15]|uniref:oligosaccharide flippase family protein n=1 Tax=Haloechinothrix sp. LS1_15 TaxID=2652248 RepID=UPI002944B897|nr:oligosaccharide flippase family protein [Haloechinothrix sp. LS1_15]MDV6013565.1 oligosaccharide flippase family protein [Haloechinothrix sp. LS1_15]
MSAQPERSTARRLSGYLASLGSAEVVGRGLSFVALVVVARVLGPDTFGQLALAQVIVLYLTALGDGGITLWSQREIVRRPHELSRIVAQTLVAQVALALVAMVVLGAIALLAPLPEGTELLILAAAPVALAQALSTVYALQALEWMRAAALVKVVTQAVAAFAAVALVLLTHQPVWVIMTMWFGQLVGAGLALAILLRRAELRAELPSMAGIRTTLVAGLPILGSLALIHYSQMMDTVVLGLLRSSYEVGIYAAAARLMMVAAVAALVITNALYPEMVRRHADSERALGEFSGTALALTLRGSLAAALLTAATAPVIIDLLYDANYADSVTILRILALLFPALCFSSLAGQVLMAAGRRRHLLWGVATGSLVATLTVPAATLTFGGLGTAVGLVASMAVQCLAFACLARGPLTTGWGARLHRELAIGLLLGAVVLLAHLTVASGNALLLASITALTLGLVELTRRASRRTPRIPNMYRRSPSAHTRRGRT